MAETATVTIDGTDYAVDQLSDNAKAQLNNLRFTDQEIARLKNRLAICNTARQAYANVLKAELNTAH